MRTQYGADKGEHGGIGSGGLAAHEKRLVTEEIRDRVDRPRAKSENFVGRMPAETLAVKRGPQLAADHCGHDWPERRRDAVGKPQGALAEIRLDHPSVMHADPIELIFGHLLKRPSRRLLGSAEPAVEVDPVFLLDVPADEGRIRDYDAIIFDIGDFALGRLGEAGGVGAIQEVRHLQQRFDFHGERAGVRQTEGWTEIIKGDHEGDSCTASTQTCLDRPHQQLGLSAWKSATGQPKGDAASWVRLRSTRLQPATRVRFKNRGNQAIKPDRQSIKNVRGMFPSPVAVTDEILKPGDDTSRRPSDLQNATRRAAASQSSSSLVVESRPDAAHVAARFSSRARHL